MADFGAPIAQNVQGPTLQTLNDVMNFKRQQQALQIGQQNLQQQQIDTKKQQIAFREQQALGQIKPKVGADGVVDADDYAQRALAAAPFSGLGQERAQKMYGVRNSQLAVQKAGQDLNEEQRKDATDFLSTGVKGLRSDASFSDVQKLFEDFRKNNPGAASVANAIESTLNPNEPVQTAIHKITAQNMALGGISKPVTGVQYNKQGQLQGTTQSQVTGAIAPAGEGVDVGLAPTQTPQYQAAVSRATGLASGGASIDTQRAGEVSSTAQSAQGQIALTQQADRLADMISSGKFPAWSAELRKNAGSNDPSIVARFELNKVLGQLKDTATAHAGSDARLATQLEQFPDATAPNEVVHSRMDYMRGVYRLAQERKDNLNAYQQKHGDLGGFQQSDDMITSSRDPMIAELRSLPKGSAERQAFLRRTFRTPDAAQQAILRERAAYHTVGASNE